MIGHYISPHLSSSIKRTGRLQDGTAACFHSPHTAPQIRVHSRKKYTLNPQVQLERVQRIELCTPVRKVDDGGYSCSVLIRYLVRFLGEQLLSGLSKPRS